MLLPQSWLHGRLLGLFDPKAVELHTSRGYETPRSKLLMRWTVLLSDIAGPPCHATPVHATTAVLLRPTPPP